MSFRVKFNLVLLLTFALAIVMAALYFRQQAQEFALDEVKHEATLSLRAALAVRTYSSKHVKPVFDQFYSGQFRREVIPAFAAIETMNELFKKYPGYVYKEIALNPLNLSNLPKEAWVMSMINAYRSGAQPYSDAAVIPHVEEQILHLVRPIKIVDQSCMGCHGDPQKAPAAMVKIYGDTHGYGWKLGDIVGVQSISIPLERSIERGHAAFMHFLWPLLGVFTLLFLTVNILLQVWVLNPLSRQNITLNHLATVDALTGVMNRRAFMERFHVELEAARNSLQPLAVLVFDLDHFKAINDTHGHAQGDVVLRKITQTISKALRSADHFARIGGEEFALLMPSTTLIHAQAVAESLRALIAQEVPTNAPHVTTPTMRVQDSTTASFGLAIWNGKESREALLKRADKAMYVAKAEGRNRVAVAEEKSYL